MHETGLPGKPNTALPSHTARIVGLPGLSETSREPPGHAITTDRFDRNATARRPSLE